MLIPPSADGRPVATWTPTRESNGNGYELPAELENVLIQAEQSDSGWWPVARALADFIAELPDAQRRTLRARVIQQAAVLRKVQPSTIRDAVHTAEVISFQIEDEQGFDLLGWQHAVRAARVGDGAKAIMILQQVIRESDNYGGQCPPVSRVNELVREANGRTPTPKRRRWSGTVVSRVVGSLRQIIIELSAGEEPPARGDMVTLVEIPQEEE